MSIDLTAWESRAEPSTLELPARRARSSASQSSNFTDSVGARRGLLATCSSGCSATAGEGSMPDGPGPQTPDDLRRWTALDPRRQPPTRIDLVTSLGGQLNGTGKPVPTPVPNSGTGCNHALLTSKFMLRYHKPRCSVYAKAHRNTPSNLDGRPSQVDTAVHQLPSLNPHDRCKRAYCGECRQGDHNAASIN